MGNDRKNAYLSRPYVNWEQHENWKQVDQQDMDTDGPCLNLPGWDVPYPSESSDVETAPSNMDIE